MKIIRNKDFTAERAWGALNIASMNGITTRPYWTAQLYRWHINDGEEVFVVLDGQVRMHYRQDGQEIKSLLDCGTSFMPVAVPSISPTRLGWCGCWSSKLPAVFNLHSIRNRHEPGSPSALPALYP